MGGLAALGSGAANARFFFRYSSPPLLLADARADDTTPEIGTAVVIKREVVATLGDDKRDLREGGRVHRSEYLETGDDARRN